MSINVVIGNSSIVSSTHNGEIQDSTSCINSNSHFGTSTIISLADTNSSAKSEQTENRGLAANGGVLAIEEKMKQYREIYDDLDIFGILSRFGIGSLDDVGTTNNQKIRNDCEQILTVHDLKVFQNRDDLYGIELRKAGIHDDLCGYIEFGANKSKILELLAERIEQLKELGVKEESVELLLRHQKKLSEEPTLTEHRKNGISNDIKMICLELISKKELKNSKKECTII